jgi:hypothetical protein
MTMTPERFRELVEEATAAAPPAPHPTSDLAAGRARLRRRRIGAAGVGLVAATVAALAVGIALTGSPRADPPPEYVHDPPSPTVTIDADNSQVLSDVVDAAFPTPGQAALRNIRVQTFVRSWGVSACGGTGAPADSTSDRFEQDVLPSLQLIREKGFTEPSQESFKGARDDCEIGDELQAAAPAWQEWFDLAGPWHELVQTVLEDSELTALRAPMAQCLHTATGVDVDAHDPATSFLGAMDGASSAERQRDAAAYADCGADYFGEVERLLLAQRPAYVSLHRQLLEQFAVQLVALGYTP